MRRHLPSPLGQTGFSFVELLASLAILALLASVAMPLAQTTVKRSKELDLRRALRDIRQGLDAYKKATAEGLVKSDPDKSGYPATLMDLVNGVPSAKNPTGPKLYFLRRMPRDPFATDASVAAAETWGQRSYESPPDNPKKGDDVYDVYSQSDVVGLNGVPYREW